MRGFVLFCTVLLFNSWSWAGDYFVREVQTEGVSQEQVKVLSSLVKDNIRQKREHRIVDSEAQADYVLQPKVFKLGENYLFKLESISNGVVIASTRERSDSVENLEDHVDKITQNLLTSQEERLAEYRVPQSQYRSPQSDEERRAEGQPQVARSMEELRPQIKSRTGWTAGFGPSFALNMESTNVMYHLTGGYLWEVEPWAAIKTLAEVNIASGADSTQFYNLGAGVNYYFGEDDPNSLYVTADMGIGSAVDDSNNSASGFSFGTGVGYQLFRESDRSMNLLLRYTFLAANLEGTDQNPSVLGGQLAFNF